MTGHRLGCAYCHIISALAEHLLDSFRFADVAKTCRSGMGINVIDLGGRHTGVLQRQLHSARSTFALRGWRCDVESVGRNSVTGELAINLRTAPPGVFELLHNHHACAFTHDEAVAVTIERARGALRFVIA